MNYRNKTVFDWNEFKYNKISSNASLRIMNLMKNKLNNQPIQNVIIRDINHQIGIIIQINLNEVDKNLSNYIYNITKKILTNYQIKFFAIQYKYNNTFIKNKNFIIYQNKYIQFKDHYFDNIIYLLPNSFFQPNIKILPEYYTQFKLWIQNSNCKNIINIGDDGGNVCAILSKYFNNMISFFHCQFSYQCAIQMKKINNLHHFLVTKNMEELYIFFNKFQDIILFINPGRKGLKNKEVEFVNQNKIEYIVYMACNDKAFQKDMLKINYQILDSKKILSMPVIDKYQILYYLKIK